MSKILNVMHTNQKVRGDNMSLKLNIDVIIQSIEFQSDVITSYLNKRTGKIFSISDEDF